MDVQEIDPNELEIDPLNERSENVGPHKGQDSLEESIRKQGLIQPPIVRRDNGALKVIVGQRRTLAAQTVGLDSIPIVVVDWDDEEALAATITENADVFRKEVSKSDRAAAIRKLMDITGKSAYELADELGVNATTLDNWIERTKPEWEDTIVHVDGKEDATDEFSSSVQQPTTKPEISREVDEISDTKLRTIRTGTKTPVEREKIVEKVVEYGLNTDQIREARKRAERSGDSFEKTIDQVHQEINETQGQIRVETRVTFTGEYAEGLQLAARDRGTSEEDIVRQAIRKYLSDEGYL